MTVMKVLTELSFTHNSRVCAGEKKDYGHSVLYQSSPKILFDSNHDNMTHRIINENVYICIFCVIV